mmetsp:Transcript_33928/g.106281  ORF Transcript_33928/g.106281 Transcript_33928/m.106281 type:complete len:656 (-) Transcript_33928:83-2050(-)
MQPNLLSSQPSLRRMEESPRRRFQMRGSRSSVGCASEHHHVPTVTDPRLALIRRQPYFSTLQSRDGTELRLCCDRMQRRRVTQAPGLGLSLFEMRNSHFWTDEPSRMVKSASEPYSRDSASSLLSPRMRERAKTQDVRYEMLNVAGDASGRIQVERLCDHGFTTEDLSRVVYDKFRGQDLPDFLDYIGLERNGGLDRLHEIWSPEKYFWFALLLCCVLFNVSYLLAMDWVIFSAFLEEVMSDVQSLTVNNITQAGDIITSSPQTKDIAQHVKDPLTRWWLLNVAVLVATWEIAWICVKVLHTIYIWWLFCFGGSEYKSFHAAMYFFQKLLPQFSTFSAIKLMAKVHPSLIYNEYLYFIYESRWRATWSGLAAVTLWFLVKCVTCAMAALGAFTIKVITVGTKIVDPRNSVLNKVGTVAALLNQCMGCVIMEVVLQDRLFLFVFGGQDAMYQDRGLAYKNVYECRMAKQIWEDFWEKGKRLQAIVLFATFDHYDLQKLLIESPPEDYNNVDLGLIADSPTESLLPINEASQEVSIPTPEDSSEEYDTNGSRSQTLVPQEPQPDQDPHRPRSKGCSEGDIEDRRRTSFPSGLDAEVRDTTASRASARPGAESAPVEPGARQEGEAVQEDSASSIATPCGMLAVTDALEFQAGWRDAL